MDFLRSVAFVAGFTLFMSIVLVLAGIGLVGQCIEEKTGWELFPKSSTETAQIDEKPFDWDSSTEIAQEETEGSWDKSYLEDIAAGNLNQQTWYAKLLLAKPSRVDEGMRYLMDAIEKDYAPAQQYLAHRYWYEQYNKTQAKKYWLLAARGPKERTRGTGSNLARNALQRYFPDEGFCWDSPIKRHQCP